MLRFLAFIIVIGFFAWLVPKYFKTPEPNGQMATADGGISSAEASYYRQIFDYTMDNVKPDQNYAWKSYSATGNITVAAAFVSKSGATCRKFRENANVGGKVYENSGVGCKRKGSDGWCKLREDNALTCAMESNWVGIPGMPSTNIAMPSFSGPDTTVNTNISGPNIHNNVDVHVDQKKAGTGYADTVTGAAGNVAGPATSNAIKWFGQTFR